MINFLIKKTFFDIWDNLLRIILLNTGFLILSAIPVYLLFLLRPNHFFSFIIIFLGLILISVYAGAVSITAVEISENKKPGADDFFNNIRKTCKSGILFSLIISLYSLVIFISMPFYLSLRNYFGILCFSILFWITLIFIMSFQYYFPVYGSLKKNFLKVVRKCILLFFNNIGFSLVLFSGVIFIICISVFVIFIIPGLAAVFIWLNTGFKILLYKYDYLDRNPDAVGKKIPWKELIKDDIAQIGKRTLKNMFLPWDEK